MPVYGKPTGISRTIKNIGSKATSTPMNKARSTAIGNNRQVTQATDSVKAYSSEMPARKAIHPGSSAGLNSYRSVHLMPNGGGYANPAHHGARYRRSSQAPTIALKNQVINARKTVRILDRRIKGSNNSSISKLSRMLDRK